LGTAASEVRTEHGAAADQDEAVARHPPQLALERLVRGAGALAVGPAALVFQGKG